MKIYHAICPVVLSVLMLPLFYCCKKEAQVIEKQGNTYAGSGAYGDLVTFDINQTNKSYTTHNETTTLNTSGNYTVLDGQLQGIYKVTTDSKTFFAVELNDKFLAANFPTGNPQNNLSMGISSEIDNSNNMTNIAGDYVYIEIDDEGYFDDGDYKEWGVVTVGSTGVFKGRAFATGGTYGLAKTISPEQWTGFPITGVVADQDFSGTFTIDAAHKERLTVAINNAPGADYHGFVYATATEGIIILDEGVGKGFLFAMKVINSSALASIAGSYKYISVLKQNNINIPVGGNATISSNGSGTYTQMFPTGTIENGILQGLTQCPNIKNMYYGNMSSTQPDGKFYLCIVGNIYFNFAFKTTGKFAFYGAGGKL